MEERKRSMPIDVTQQNQDLQPSAPPQPVDAARHKHANKALITIFIVLVAIICGLGYLLLSSDKEAQDQQELSQNQPENLEVNEIPAKEATVTSEINMSLVEYSSNDYGFSFTYPEVWGEVEEVVTNNKEGQSAIYKFTNRPRINAGLKTKDYVPVILDGKVCFIGLGFHEPFVLDEIIEGDRVFNEGDENLQYRRISSEVYRDSTTLISDTFVSGVGEGAKSCPGYSMKGDVAFEESAVVYGVGFFFGTPYNSIHSGIPFEYSEQYVEYPSELYDDIDREYFIEMIKSTKVAQEQE